MVPGRIHRREFREFWEKELMAPQYILDMLEMGYKLPLTQWPPKSVLPNNGSALRPENRPVVDESLHDLEKDGAIERVEEEPWIIIPLQIAVSAAGKKRLVADASRQLNQFLEFEEVQLDHLQRVLPEIPEGVYFGTTDLTHGYYHLEVAEAHRTLLGIRWTFQNGETVTFRWRATFLGLASLVRDFTKLLKPIKAYLQSQGILNFI